MVSTKPGYLNCWFVAINRFTLRILSFFSCCLKFRYSASGTLKYTTFCCCLIAWSAKSPSLIKLPTLHKVIHAVKGCFYFGKLRRCVCQCEFGFRFIQFGFWKRQFVWWNHIAVWQLLGILILNFVKLASAWRPSVIRLHKSLAWSGTSSGLFTVWPSSTNIFVDNLSQGLSFQCAEWRESGKRIRVTMWCLLSGLKIRNFISSPFLLSLLLQPVTPVWYLNRIVWVFFSMFGKCFDGIFGDVFGLNKSKVPHALTDTG